MGGALAQRLGIERPLLAFSHSEHVVVAVSRAGGMGVLGAAQLTVDELERKLGWLDDQLGGVPYGVDLLLPGKYEEADEGGLDRDAARRRGAARAPRLRRRG